METRRSKTGGPVMLCIFRMSKVEAKVTSLLTSTVASHNQPAEKGGGALDVPLVREICSSVLQEVLRSTNATRKPPTGVGNFSAMESATDFNQTRSVLEELAVKVDRVADALEDLRAKTQLSTTERELI